MGSECNISNALGDAAQTLAQEIAFCRTCAERCLNIAWEAGPERHAARESLLQQAQGFMHMSTELAGALAKLKGDANTHRQHISVERIERASLAKSSTKSAPPGPAVWVPPKPRAPIAVGMPPYEADPEEVAAEEARAARALAEYNAETEAQGAGGRGEGRIPENESLR